VQADQTAVGVEVEGAGAAEEEQLHDGEHHRLADDDRPDHDEPRLAEALLEHAAEGDQEVQADGERERVPQPGDEQALPRCGWRDPHPAVVGHRQPRSAGVAGPPP
jgi:hypothetical protein